MTSCTRFADAMLDWSDDELLTESLDPEADHEPFPLTRRLEDHEETLLFIPIVVEGTPPSESERTEPVRWSDIEVEVCPCCGACW